ncbi:unnamed protein product [Phytophthora fragariaefolia]|uniref:Unnamed protein product n=1 Tax=Phytophthora fragariaefolia TaxID=1490495 RepID=A0A9W7CX25_9STRA|nr:unnamed protein product [Phytophthora fragariaefolia]
MPVMHKSVDLPDMVIKTAALSSKVIPGRPTRIIPFMSPSSIDTGYSRPQTIEEESNDIRDLQKSSINEIAPSPLATAGSIDDPPQALVEQERGNQAWVTPPTPKPCEPPSIHAVHPLTRPYTSIAQGRKITLEALPKAKLGAQESVFDRLDSLGANNIQHEELEHNLSHISTVDNKEHPTQVNASEQRYALITDVASTVENKLVPTVTPETLQRHHEKTLALQQLAQQMAEQAGHSLDDSLPGGRASLAGAADESELHDMIVKIRDSPHEQPKRNFQSERVMLRGTYLFHPQEPAIVLWQFFVGIGIIYSIIVVPFRLGYDVDATGGWYVLEMIIDGFFLVDIVINFRTAYFDEERRLIYDPRTLFWRYAKGWFVLDLISTVPIDELFQ